MKSKLINFLLFQFGWFTAILGAAYGRTSEAIIVSVVIILIHLKVIQNYMQDIKLFIYAAIIGFLFDGLIQYNSLILYNNPGWPYPLTPLWIIILWIMFAMTLNHSLSWLKGRMALAALFGSIGGPLAYIAGEKLGAITITETQALFVLSLGWAVFTPLLVYLSQKND
jgi:hypothetical protein